LLSERAEDLMLTSRFLLSDQLATRADRAVQRARRIARRIRATAWLDDPRCTRRA
jgi:hypothetical protein